MLPFWLAPVATNETGTRRSGRPALAGVAQLVEQLIRNQQVSGSSPLAGSIRKACIRLSPDACRSLATTWLPPGYDSTQEEPASRRWRGCPSQAE